MWWDDAWQAQMQACSRQKLVLGSRAVLRGTGLSLQSSWWWAGPHGPIFSVWGCSAPPTDDFHSHRAHRCLSPGDGGGRLEALVTGAV